MNGDIRRRLVRLIGSDGEMVGDVTPAAALARASAEGLDVVEISPNAEPPVCRIMDFGKFLYEKSKAAKEQKKSRSRFRSRKSSSGLLLTWGIIRLNCAT